jgi:hypothetical protein
MALTYAEAFVRAYAENAVKSIRVAVDKDRGVTQLSFHGRQQEVNMRDLVLQEDAFRRLGKAVHALLCIPEEPEPTEPVDVTQITPESST